MSAIAKFVGSANRIFQSWATGKVPPTAERERISIAHDFRARAAVVQAARAGTVSFDASTEEGQDPSLLLATERGPDQKTERREELIALEKAISELPEELKNAFILTALEDRQQAETAELLGLSLKAVETRVYRGFLECEMFF